MLITGHPLLREQVQDTFSTSHMIMVWLNKIFAGDQTAFPFAVSRTKLSNTSCLTPDLYCFSEIMVLESVKSTRTLLILLLAVCQLLNSSCTTVSYTHLTL